MISPLRRERKRGRPPTSPCKQKSITSSSSSTLKSSLGQKMSTKNYLSKEKTKALKDELKNCKKVIENQRKIILNLDKTLNKENEELSELKQTVSNYKKKIKFLEKQAQQKSKLSKKVANLMAQPSKKAFIEAKSLNYQVNELKSTLCFLRRELKNKQRQCDEFRREVIEIKSLLSYKEEPKSNTNFSISHQYNQNLQLYYPILKEKNLYKDDEMSAKPVVNYMDENQCSDEQEDIQQCYYSQVSENQEEEEGITKKLVVCKKKSQYPKLYESLVEIVEDEEDEDNKTSQVVESKVNPQ